MRVEDHSREELALAKNSSNSPRFELGFKMESCELGEGVREQERGFSGSGTEQMVQVTVEGDREVILNHPRV